MRWRAGRASADFALCWLIFRIFSQFFAFFRIFWRILSYLAIFGRFFMILDRFFEVLGRVWEGFWEDFSMILDDLFEKR